MVVREEKWFAKDQVNSKFILMAHLSIPANFYDLQRVQSRPSVLHHEDRFRVGKHAEGVPMRDETQRSADAFGFDLPSHPR